LSRNWPADFKALSKEHRSVKDSELTYKKLKKLNGSLLLENAPRSPQRISELS
jgi:hypothetical protein